MYRVFDAFTIYIRTDGRLYRLDILRGFGFVIISLHRNVRLAEFRERAFKPSTV